MTKSGPVLFPREGEDETNLCVDLKGRGVFNEGLHHSAAAHRRWSHHKHLVLLYCLEEGPHVGPHDLDIELEGLIKDSSTPDK